MLTIAKLKRWSINYYIDTAKTAQRATSDRARAGGGLGEYYCEHETRTPVWLVSGDTHTTARLVGLTDHQRAGGEADAETVARWLDDGTAPSGARGRAFGVRGVHGFDLTFCAPKSVSLVRALKTDDVIAKSDRRRAHHRTRRGNGVSERTCGLYAGAQPGDGGEGSGAPARIGGDRLSA
jgi:hypothetical protein